MTVRQTAGTTQHSTAHQNRVAHSRPDISPKYCHPLKRPVAHLVEAAQPQCCVWHPAAGQELLRGCLDVHEGDLGVLVAVEDGHEHVAADAHGLAMNAGTGGRYTGRQTGGQGGGSMVSTAVDDMDMQDMLACAAAAAASARPVAGLWYCKASHPAHQAGGSNPMPSCSYMHGKQQTLRLHSLHRNFHMMPQPQVCLVHTLIMRLS